MAGGQQLVEDRAHSSQVTAAGAEQCEEVVDGPGREDSGAGEAEADRVDPVPVGGVEEQVAGELPGGAL
ncbi:hypothetical protein [Streptomyces sp. NPDC127036]|uniref:hypothetical protein n=1 Tax=Streptomyces sp. NPDC127036 TaxID=3347112 RepID=UPI00366710CF